MLEDGDWIFDAFDGCYPEDIKHVAVELCCGHLDQCGGYEYDSDIEDGRMIIATLDDGKDNMKTLIEYHDMQDLRDWEQRAIEYKHEVPKCSWREAVNETMEE